MNLTIELSNDLLFKTAASKTLIRPALDKLAYKRSVELSEFKYHDGNPELKPTYASQWEVGLEWYFTDAAILSASYFEKTIDSVIRESNTGIVEDVVKYNANGSIDGVYDFDIFQHLNASGTYKVKGFDLIVQVPLSIMHMSLENFHINANYSRLNNKLTAESDLNILVSPEGLADETYNFVLYFDNQIFDAHLSYTYKGAYVEYIERDMYPVYRDDYGQLDFVVGYQYNDNIKLALKGINLTDEKTRGYTMSAKFPVIHEISGKRLAANITVKF